jgi:hypothetical protein
LHGQRMQNHKKLDMSAKNLAEGSFKKFWDFARTKIKSFFNKG